MIESETGGLTLRAAEETDVETVLRCVKALAEYERLPVDVTEERLRGALFGPSPMAAVELAYVGSELVGYALFYETFSSFTARPGLYLEGLFVWPAWRGRGIGRALLRRVAVEAVERGCGRLEWAVLNWNEPAIRFYQGLGAEAQTEWTVYRMAGPGLAALAAEGGSQP